MVALSPELLVCDVLAIESPIMIQGQLFCRCPADVENKVAQCALPHELLAICTHLPVRLQWRSAFCIAAAKFPLPEVAGLMVAMKLTVIHELVQIICRQGTRTLAYCVHPLVYV